MPKARELGQLFTHIPDPESKNTRLLSRAFYDLSVAYGGAFEARYIKFPNYSTIANHDCDITAYLFVINIMSASVYRK